MSVVTRPPDARGRPTTANSQKTLQAVRLVDASICTDCAVLQGEISDYSDLPATRRSQSPHRNDGVQRHLLHARLKNLGYAKKLCMGFAVQYRG